MKTSGWVVSIIAGAALVGGGAWAVSAAQSDEPQDVAYTGAYEPVDTATPTVSPEPAEIPDSAPETPAEPLEATPAATPEAGLSDGESELVWLTQTQLLADLELSEAEILDAAAFVCAAPAGTSYDTLELRGADDADIRQFWTDAKYHAC